MDFSALGRCHQPIHQHPRRSSVSCEHSFKLRFSRFFIVPAGARLFYLGVLALLLTLPWNPPSAYAWSFSNGVIPAPPTVMDLDAPLASPPAIPTDVPRAAPPKVLPSPSHVLTSPSLPSGSPPPISMASPPSPSVGAPGPASISKKTESTNWGLIVGGIVLAVVSFGICSSSVLYKFYWKHPLRIFISHGGASNGSRKKRRANQRVGKENDLMTYINKRLQLLFALSGLLNILLSVILDNFFNDLPVRFTAFGILAPLTIFLGFLASGWFPQIPLQFIRFVKQRGFLQHVVPCSPWHDNVVTNYCGEICLLEPLEREEGTRLLDFPMSIQNFLYSDQISPQGTTATTTTHSTFDPEIQGFQMATLVQESQDLQGVPTASELLNGILEPFDLEMATSQAPIPNLQETPSQVENIVVDIDRLSIFHTSNNKRAPILEFDGPEIYGFPFKVQAFKNISTTNHTFDLSCSFRNEKTKKIYLTAERLQNLLQNMCKWVENPYPIVIDESSNILHCLAIEDILWEFTKMVYTFRQVHVEHRILAGFWQIKFFFTLAFVFVSFVLALIPLTLDKKSPYFLFFLFVLVPYLFVSCDTNPLTFYRFKSLFCPICIKIFRFDRLYKWRSSFRWCNEFRKKRIVNPSYFWIDQEYSNTFPDKVTCYNVCGFPEFSRPRKDESFTMSCQGWRIQVPGGPPTCTQQHEYKLRVTFDAVKPVKDVNCYTNLRLAFFEKDHCLGDFSYSVIEVQKLDFIEQLFHCFSDPSFGGYVKKICPMGYFSTTFVAHCPRFIDICSKICGSDPVPKLLVASRMPGSKFIVGVPFCSSEL